MAEKKHKQITITSYQSSTIQAMKKITPEEINLAIDRMSKKLNQSRKAYIDALTEFVNDMDGIDLAELEESDKILLEAARDFLTKYDHDKDDLLLHTRLAKISQYGIMKDKTNLALISDSPVTLDIDGQLKLQWAVNQASKKETTPVPTYIAIGFIGDEEKIKTGTRITSKDNAVFQAASNLVFLLQQQEIPFPYFITPEDIWRTMNGITGNKRSPTPNQLEDVCKRIDKMRFTSLYMDISKEIDAHYITIDDERLKGGKIETYYLKADKSEFYTEKGRIIDGYRFDEIPFYYKYNCVKGRIVLVPYELLDTSDTTGNEGYTVEIRNYLLLQIAKLYRGDRNNCRILYDTLYRETAIPIPANRVQREKYRNEASYTATIKRYAQKDREKIAALLDSWVNKKWILGYKQAKSGRTFIGVDIQLNPDNFKANKQTHKVQEASSKKKLDST